MIGKSGVEKVFEVSLNAEEKAALDNSAEHVRELIKKVNL